MNFDFRRYSHIRKILAYFHRTGARDITKKQLAELLSIDPKNTQPLNKAINRGLLARVGEGTYQLRADFIRRIQIETPYGVIRRDLQLIELNEHGRQNILAAKKAVEAVLRPKLERQNLLPKKFSLDVHGNYHIDFYPARFDPLDKKIVFDTARELKRWQLEQVSAIADGQKNWELGAYLLQLHTKSSEPLERVVKNTLRHIQASHPNLSLDRIHSISTQDFAFSPISKQGARVYEVGRGRIRHLPKSDTYEFDFDQLDHVESLKDVLETGLTHVLKKNGSSLSRIASITFKSSLASLPFMAFDSAHADGGTIECIQTLFEQFVEAEPEAPAYTDLSGVVDDFSPGFDDYVRSAYTAATTSAYLNFPSIGMMVGQEVAVNQLFQLARHSDSHLNPYAPSFLRHGSSPFQQTDELLWGLERSEPRNAFTAQAVTNRTLVGLRYALRAAQMANIGLSVGSIYYADNPELATAVELGRHTGGIVGAMGGAYAGSKLSDKLLSGPAKLYPSRWRVPVLSKLSGALLAGGVVAEWGARLANQYADDSLFGSLSTGVYHLGAGLKDLPNNPESALVPAAPMLLYSARNQSRFGQSLTPKSFSSQHLFEDIYPVRGFKTFTPQQSGIYVVDTEGRFRWSPEKITYWSQSTGAYQTRHIGHIDIANGKPLVAAGEIAGEKYSFYTGHYRVPNDGSLNHIVERAIQRAKVHPAMRVASTVFRVGGTFAAFVDAAQTVGFDSDYYDVSPTGSMMLAGMAYYPPALAIPITVSTAKCFGEMLTDGASLYRQQLDKHNIPIYMTVGMDGLSDYERTAGAEVLGRGLSTLGDWGGSAIQWLKRQGDAVVDHVETKVKKVVSTLADAVVPTAHAAPAPDSGETHVVEESIHPELHLRDMAVDHFLQSLPDQLSMAPPTRRSTADDMKYFFTNYFWKNFGEEPGDGDPYQQLIEKLQGRRPEGKTGLWINFGFAQAQLLPDLVIQSAINSSTIRLLNRKADGEQIPKSEFAQVDLAEKVRDRLSSGLKQASSDKLSLEESQHVLDNTFSDIEGMLEEHEPLTQFADDTALQESKTMKKMSGINDAVTTMLKFHTAEEIDASAYMHVEAVQEAHTALEAAKSENASPEVIHTHQLSLKRALSQAAVDQKEFQQSLSDIGQCASGMAAMLSVFGQSEAAHQITTIVSAGTAVAACVDRLQSGATTALGMGASVMGLLGAVSSIYGLFIRQKSQDMSQVILQAIQDISRQVETLRDEMHRRFDDFESLLEKRHRALLDNFCHLHQATAINHAYIRQLYIDVNELFYDQAQRMKPMDTMLKRLEDTLTHRQLEASRDELNRLMHLIMAHPVKPFDRYDEVANQLKAIALSDSVTHQPSNPMILHNLERHPDNYLHFVTHYYGLLSFSLGFDEDSKLPDMSIMLPALLFNLVMDIKQFPNPELAEAHLKPSRGVANRYEDYLAALNQYASNIVNARRDTVVGELIEEYERAATEFGRALESQLSQIEEKQTKLVRAETASKLGPLRESYKTGLVNTNIEPGTYGWFEGQVYRGYRYHAGKSGWPNGSSYTGATHVDQAARRVYLETLTTQIKAHKQHASASAQESRHEVESVRLSVYADSQISLYHGAGVLVPYDAALPYLPLPDPLFDEAHEPEFLKIARQAQAAGVGDIEFRYSIYHKNIISISVFINTSYKPIHIGDFSFTLNMRYFNQPEGIWHDWMGGKIPPDRDGTRHHVCVSGRFIPKWQSWANTHTSAQVVSLVANDVMVCKTGVGHKAGCYDFSLALYHNPKPLVEIKGKSELLKTHTVDELLVIFSSTQAGIDNVLDLIKASKQTFKTKCLEVLRDSLDTQRDTALGKACYELESTFRDLYGMCSFAFHDTMADSESPLAQWFSQYALDLEAVKDHYRAVDNAVSPRQLVENMTSKLPELTQIIKQTRAALIDRQHGLVDPNFVMMAEVTQQIHAVLAFYEPHLTEFEDMVDVAGGLQHTMAVLTHIIAGVCTSSMPADTINTLLTSSLNFALDNLETENPATKSYWVSLLKQKMTDKKLPIAWQGNKMLLYKPASETDSSAASGANLLRA